MKSLSNERGFTLVELLFTMAVIAVVGLVLYSLLTLITVLGAKNAALNTAHQQARTAMVRMQQDLHSAVSTPYLVDGNGNQVTGDGPSGRNLFSKVVQRAAPVQERRRMRVKIRLPSRLPPGRRHRSPDNA